MGSTVSYVRYSIAGGNAIVVQWASLSTSSGTGDVGQVYPSSLDYALGGMLFADKSIQVFNQSVVVNNDQQVLIEGSNEMNTVSPTNLTFGTLSDAQGNALLFSQTGTTIVPRIEQILENCVYIRPRVSTQSLASAAMNVFLLITSTRNARSGM